MSGPKRCDCACHEHGARVFHAFPCCDQPIEADSLGTRESRFPAVPGSSVEPEKKPDPLEGELLPPLPVAAEDLRDGEFVTVDERGRTRRAASATAPAAPIGGEVLPRPVGHMKPAPLGMARPFADPAQESALAPLFRDFACIFGRDAD